MFWSVILVLVLYLDSKNNGIILFVTSTMVLPPVSKLCPSSWATPHPLLAASIASWFPGLIPITPFPAFMNAPPLRFLTIGIILKLKSELTSFELSNPQNPIASAIYWSHCSAVYFGVLLFFLYQSKA